MRLPKKPSNCYLIITALALSIIGGGAWCLFSEAKPLEQKIVKKVTEKVLDTAVDKVADKAKEELQKKVIDKIFE